MLSAITVKRQLRKGPDTRTFVIASAARVGWELQDWVGDRIVRRLELTDWHRVERARLSLEREVSTLMGEGWTETAAS